MGHGSREEWYQRFLSTTVSLEVNLWGFARPAVRHQLSHTTHVRQTRPSMEVYHSCICLLILVMGLDEALKMHQYSAPNFSIVAKNAPVLLVKEMIANLFQPSKFQTGQSNLTIRNLGLVLSLLLTQTIAGLRLYDARNVEKTSRPNQS